MTASLQSHLTEVLVLAKTAQQEAISWGVMRPPCLHLVIDNANVFSPSLGMTADNAEELRQILLEVVQVHDAQLGRQDEFGQRYTLDFKINWQNRSATLRSGWMIEYGSAIPRLTTCYPL